MSEIKTTVSIFIATILVMGVSIFVPSLLSQSAHANFNNCSSGDTLCQVGGTGSAGGGTGGQRSLDTSSGDATFIGGTGVKGGGSGGHIEGNIYTGEITKCAGNICP
jgi:hypothetical protein